MGSDHALYVEVDHVDQLRALVDAEQLALAPACAFGRAASSRWDLVDLVRFAGEVSAERDAIVLAYSSVTGVSAFAMFRSGAPVRQLAYGDGWSIVAGEPESWEAGLATSPVQGAIDPTFDAWTACDLVGSYYRLTGWFESQIPPAPRDPATEIRLRTAVHELLSAKRDKAERATSLIEALEANGIAAFRRELFVAHDDCYVLLGPDGKPHVRGDRTCGAHGAEVTLPIYTSRADVDAYMESWEAPVFAVTPSARMTGAQVLAVASERGANALLFNWLGEHYYGDYLNLTTMKPCP